MSDYLARIVFWLSAATLIYAYIAYPLILWGIARVRPRLPKRTGPTPTRVSILLAVRNESANIRTRLAELTDLIATPGIEGEVIVVSDGSTDETAEIAREFVSRGVLLTEWTENQGKAAAISHAASLAQYEILALADARQRWEQDALQRMLENFADPSIGGVSGSLILEEQPGVLAGVGVYWKFEKWLRQQQSRTYSIVSVTGAICCVRRELFRPIPLGMLIDDMYWPMQVVTQGYRVIQDERAVAYDRLPSAAKGEMRRKVRTLAGIFQLLAAIPSLLNPWRNPAWITFVSHKVLRVVAPWAMLGMLAGSGLAHGTFYRVAFAGQLLAFGLGIWGLSTKAGGRQRICSTAGSFLLLHAAAWLAFWIWVSGSAGRVWRSSQFSNNALDGASQA